MGAKAFKLDKVLCKKFGEKVKFFRMERGFKQDELAFLSKISPSYLSAIERGITDTTISTVKRLSKALGVKFSDVLEFDK